MLPNGSFQRFKRSAYFFIGWTLFVIRFDPGPGDFSLRIDHVNCGMRNPVNLLTFIGGITQPVGVNDFMFGVRENRKTECALAISGNLVREALTYIRWVDTDCEEFYVFPVLQKSSESGQLPGTVRSPITAIEDQYYRALSPRFRQSDLPPVLILESEVWGRLADHDWRHALRHHLNFSSRDSH